MSIKNWPGGRISDEAPVPSGSFQNSTASGVWTLDQQAYWKAQNQWPTAGNIQPDPNFENVTMLLHGDGTNGGQNNTFLDSSTNNFTITRNGNTTQGSFSPYGPNWSNYFDGASDYLNLGYRSALELTSQNFTIEFWLNQSATATGMICGTWRTNSSAYVWGIFSGGAGLGFSYSTSGSYQSANDGKVGTSVSIGVWTHIAIVRNGTTLTLYKDGVSVSTSTSMTNPVSSSQQFWIGGNAGDSQWLGGYISNMRITNTVVYTANFTPSTTPLTAISGTQLLTCADNRFIDDSTNNFAITVVGTPSVQRFSPFAPTSPGYTTATIGGSGFFDGNLDALTVNGMSSSVSDFCIEMWAYSTVSLASGTRVLFGEWGGGLGNLSLCRFNGGFLELNLANTAVFNISAATHGVTANNWAHIAFTRSGSTTRAFVNGVQVASTTFSTSVSFNRLNIAGERFGAFNTECWAGYLTDSRVVIGSAVYTSNFTPPSAPLTAITNTSLLLNFTNAAIFDNAMMNDLETVGNAQISTSVVKFGTGSMAFDGSGDWLRTPSTPSNGLGAGNFTVEMWVYLNNTTGTQVFVTTANPTLDFSPAFYNSGGDLRWYDGSVKSTGGTLSAGVWTHIAACRASGTLRFFINGTQTPTTYSVATNYGSSVPIIVGSNNYGESLNGYIDDLRITNGVARYTANFTPPTAAFPDI
jgi:hypothetical protein